MSTDNLREKIERRLPARKPGIYGDISLNAYVHDPAGVSLSAGLAHTLLSRSPRHAWYAHSVLNPDWQQEATEGSDLGSIAHALFLEGGSNRVVVVEADDWRTKAAKEARDVARLQGKLPILAARYEQVKTMTEEVARVIAESELGDTFRDGQAEQTMLWQEDGIWFRTRPDWISRDRRVLVDYKTTSAVAEPDSWARTQLLGMGYDMQAAFGLRAVSVLAPHTHEPVFVFVVQETDPPYAVSFVSLSPAWRAWAEGKRLAAVTEWAHCLSTDSWPGYPTRIAYAEPPGWAVTGWLAGQTMDDGRPLAEQLFGKE